RLDTDGDGSVGINELVAAVDHALSGCPGVSPTPTATPGDGALSVADAVARDRDGDALRLGTRVSVEGVVTVDAGLFANSKLKVC
ncbi:hypothetical protein, partial [Salmonella enterica]|uniref:hypothetical protein n=1 Tax=Salmonella enterica TaxID=28901 RepID=UPI003F4B30E7